MLRNGFSLGKNLSNAPLLTTSYQVALSGAKKMTGG